MKSITKHHLLLHFIVLIWGWAPILGRYITTDTMQLVWFRIVFTLPIMGVYFLVIKHRLSITRRDLLKLSGIGVIICVHWLCFYEAIKVGNVSVTMAAFSTGTLFTAITEPLFYKRKIYWYELAIGLVIIGAICLIFSVEIHYWFCIVLGISAAFTAACFSVMNSLLVKRIPAATISFYELLAAVTALSIYLLATQKIDTAFFTISPDNLFFIFILAAVGTVFPFIASTGLMKYLSPYTITLTVNLESVYGIILACILFQENKELSTTFYIGVGIILVAIFLNAYIKQRLQKGKSFLFF